MIKHIDRRSITSTLTYTNAIELIGLIGLIGMIAVGIGYPLLPELRYRRRSHHHRHCCGICTLVCCITVADTTAAPQDWRLGWYESPPRCVLVVDAATSSYECCRLIINTAACCSFGRHGIGHGLERGLLLQHLCYQVPRLHGRLPADAVFVAGVGYLGLAALPRDHQSSTHRLLLCIRWSITWWCRDALGLWITVPQLLPLSSSLYPSDKRSCSQCKLLR